MDQVQLPDTDTYCLHAAVLLYRNGDHTKCLATRHGIGRSGQLQPGRPLRPADIDRLFRDPNPTATHRLETELTWHPHLLLATSQSSYIWWTPPGFRAITWKEPQGKVQPMRAWFPGLVWRGGTRRSGDGLTVIAVAGDQAPGPETEAYFLDLSNVGSAGHVCLGSMNPGDYSPEAWTKGFFESTFSHGKKGLHSQPFDVRKCRTAGTINRVFR